MKRLISYLILYIGYIWILFDKEHQGWHDKLCSSIVVKKGNNSNHTTNNYISDNSQRYNDNPYNSNNTQPTYKRIEKINNEKGIHAPSLILSIIGVVFFWGITSYIGLPCAIIGLVMGIKKRQTHKTVASIVMSSIAIGIQIIYFVIAFNEALMNYM